MNDHFFAIGVAQGDAFAVKRRNDFVALVDGGKSVAGFHTAFLRATKCNSADVIVCTHNDADHANGIIGFLQSGLQCKEVWLPASWAGRLNDLFDPAKFAFELLDDIAGLGDAEFADIKDTDTLFERLANGREAKGLIDAEETVDAEELAERALEQDNGDYIELSRSPLFYWYPEWWSFLRGELRTHDPRFRLFMEAIAAGERIKQIAQLAFHRGCRIRWFQYSQAHALGGISGKLVPVNAREVQQVAVNRSSALIYLALTITNRQSLVFSSPQQEGAAAVLFTADSDLSFRNRVPWSDGMIITAPHHGSDANAGAYQRFHREIGRPSATVWVRSDGKFRSRPGQSFLNLKNAGVPVFCTLCRGASNPKQDLAFTAATQSWSPVNTKPCVCR